MSDDKPKRRMDQDEIKEIIQVYEFDRHKAK